MKGRKLSKELVLTRESIPLTLWEQCNCGFEIRFVYVDVRPCKKYVYAFKEYLDYYIVTTDDDIVYHTDMGGLY